MVAEEEEEKEIIIIKVKINNLSIRNIGRTRIVSIAREKGIHLHISPIRS